MPAFKPTALLLALLSAASVQAQSLNELYQAARAYDASYLSARSASEAAQHRLSQAAALRKGSVGLGLSSSHSQIDPPASFAMVAGTRVQVAGDRVGLTTNQADVNAKLALFNRANGATISQAERGVLVAQADLEAAEQDLMVRVAQAYFDVLAARELLATAQASKKAIAEQLAAAKRAFEVGTATILGTREAQAGFDRALAQEIAAENDLRVKKVILDQLVGRNEVDPKPLATPVALPAVEPLNIEPWLAQGEQNHPLVRKARLGLEVAQLEIDKAKAAQLPTLDLVGNLRSQNLRGSAAQTPGTTNSATVGLQFSMPLYSGGAIQGRIAEALVLADKSRNDLDFARRSVAEGTRRAFLGLQSLTAQVKAFEANETSSKLALEATQLSYKVGVSVNLDVLNAQARLYATQNDLAKARFDSLVTGLRLRQAAGQLRPEDIAALDALLAK